MEVGLRKVLVRSLFVLLSTLFLGLGNLTFAYGSGVVKVYDCFPFFNEVDILEIRLHELNSAVDKFVIVEACKTHQGKPKKSHFLENKERFKEFLHKIDYHFIDLPESKDPWVRERYQRDFIQKALEKLSLGPRDLVIVSDLDEIPKSSKVRAAKKMLLSEGVNFFIFNLETYIYFLNMYAIDAKWAPTYAASYQFFTTMTPSLLRAKSQWKDTGMTKTVIFQKSGWHFTWQGGFEAALKKFDAYAHEFFDKDGNKIYGEQVVDQILDALSNTKNAINGHGFGCGSRLKWQKIDGRFPKFVQKNKKALSKKGFIKSDPKPKRKASRTSLP